MKQWKFVTGYVKIILDGYRPERAINAMIAEDITAHDIVRVKRGEFTAYVKSKSLKRLSEIAGECDCRLTVIKEYGFPVFLRLAVSKLPLLVTLALGFAALFALSKRLLFIRIEGCDAVNENAVAGVIADFGVTPGILMNSFDAQPIKDALIELDERIGFVDLRRHGVVLSAVIHEVDSIAPDDEPELPSSIFADKDCVIIGIIAEDGNAAVIPGQAVKKGELLISGNITPEGQEDLVLVHAKGEIIAEVVYRFSVTVQPESERLVRSGEWAEISRLSVFGYDITAPPGFDNYETEFGTSRTLSACGIPVELSVLRAYELIMGKARLTPGEMQESAAACLDEMLRQGIPKDARITSKQTEYSLNEDGTLTAVMRIQTIEKVGCTKVIRQHYTERVEQRLIMEEVKKTVEIRSMDEQIRLFGVFDENLKVIEAETGTSIRSDAENILISGEEENAAIAQNVIEKLLMLIRKDEKIDRGRIRYAIDLAREGNSELILELADDVIAFTNRGKQIKCKTVGQKRYINALKHKTVVFGVGPAGTGKTYLAVAMAVLAFKNKEVSRIILTRPAVEAGEKLGFLPGDLQNKVDPYLRPLYDALYDFLGAENFRMLSERGAIEVAPLAYMRGRTLNDAYIILDEAQNCTIEQMKMFLTRFGEGSRVVVTGDITQIDLPIDKKSGLIHAIQVLSDVEGIEIVRLTARDVVRHEMVQRIVQAYERASERAAERKNRPQADEN